VTDLPEPVATPDLGEGNHLAYAVQWFIFAIAVAVGWVLAIRRSIATRRREAELELSSGDPDAGGTIDGTQPTTQPTTTTSVP
jgi:hypothetical protein